LHCWKANQDFDIVTQVAISENDHLHIHSLLVGDDTAPSAAELLISCPNRSPPASNGSRNCAEEATGE
jgi:hypothetical protein